LFTTGAGIGQLTYASFKRQDVLGVHFPYVLMTFSQNTTKLLQKCSFLLNTNVLKEECCVMIFFMALYGDL